MRPPLDRGLLSLGLTLVLACGGPATPKSVEPSAEPPSRRVAESALDTFPEPRPILAPAEAFHRGWMPLRATGVLDYLKAHPTYDGRGVLIAILDSGIDPGIPGLSATSTGERKLLDLRDFSGEGAVPLTPATPVGDAITVAGQRLAGVARLRSLMVGGEIWAGTIAELPLGEMPAADLNGDHDDRDTLAVVVVRASDGWTLFVDTDGDGSLTGEKPVHDYLAARETFSWRTGRRPAGHTVAANFAEVDGKPTLDLFFDTSAHGSHVAGIAAAHDLYGVPGFEGVAPGAQLLGLKIANNAQGGISTSGSMLAALDYAIRFAETRHLPLVINMSFGVGNEQEGDARIDQLVDSVLALHPDVVFCISAGNDGPGLSSMGYPGSARLALTIGATLPGVFLGASGNGNDPIAYFSSRGGELAKPDLVTPGMAYSSVPRWNTGDERKGGTSMASPHAAGLVALLRSGLLQEGRSADARTLRQALMVTARPLATGTYLDEGTGQADVGLAWRWLGTARNVPDVVVRAHDHGQTAAWRVRALGEVGDTLQRFDVALPAGAAPLDVTLRSTAPWIRTPPAARLTPSGTSLTLSYASSALSAPGTYVGVVTGWTADTTLGPVLRLVNTIVVPDTGALVIAKLGRIPPGGDARVFFRADAGRPFVAAFVTGGAGEQVLAWLHEPGGQPYREDNGIGAGAGEEAGIYAVDGRDVVPGLYEAIAVAPPLDEASATIIVQQSPLVIDAHRGLDSVAISLSNVSPESVRTEPFIVLVGAERSARIVANGGAAQRIRFALPDWAVHATVDVTMDRAQWPRFTDFGVTLFDGVGRQLGKAPLNYAFGRLHVSLPTDGPRVGEVGLFPGFADTTGDQRWTASVSIRLYADSARVTQLEGHPVDVAPGRTAVVSIPFAGTALPLGDAFFPLGIVVAPEADRTWTREVPLPTPATPMSQ